MVHVNDALNANINPIAETDVRAGQMGVEATQGRLSRDWEELVPTLKAVDDAVHGTNTRDETFRL